MSQKETFKFCHFRMLFGSKFLQAYEEEEDLHLSKVQFYILILGSFVPTSDFFFFFFLLLLLLSLAACVALH